MIFGKYQLLDILGRGGMAEVFKAKSYGVEGFEKLLVIKRILPNLTDNERFVDMFINEAKIAVSLNHANIVQVFDLGKVGDSYYIAMEFVQGMDLASIIKKCNSLGKKLPLELAAFIGSEIAKGLDYAHRRRDQNMQPLNIIHRDISPHNILVSFEGEVKITDFGIAKAKDTIAEEDGIIKGKYAYMAPEQAQGKKHNRSVDIFSLGIVLYEAVSGINPLKGGPSSEIIKRSLSQNYPTLMENSEAQKVPEELSEIVTKAMEPLAGDRYAGAGELYESLIAFLYNTGTRVGAHSLSAFLDELREEEEVPIAPKNEAHLIAAFGGGTSTTSATGLTGSEESVVDITSIQVPTGTPGEETGATTGARSLAAEFRDATVLAMEFVGPPMPIETLDRFEQIIGQNGGNVVEKRNDLLVALFGLEAADGRDTQDAINTALTLQRAAIMTEMHTSSMQIGVGVHPDKIVMMSNGEPREDDAYFGAVAVARNLAKQGLGWVITSDAGRRLASNSFRFEDVTTTAVAGSDTVVCKVVGRRPVAETYGKLFGRREELRTIGEMLALVSRGSGRILALIGEAGTGKTRILHEVHRRLVSGGHDVGWYEAACVPWRSTPFAAVASMFRAILGVGDIEPESELKNKIERLRELGLIPEEVDAVASVLGVSHQHDVGPEERGRQLRSAIIRAASSLSADKMTVLFWDDLLYVDKESLDILYYLGRSLGHMPILLGVAFRPGFENGWVESTIYNEIGLNPLSENDSKRLALSRMKARRAPEDLLIDIALKSAGNPLYIEEYVKALMDNEVVRVHSGEAIYDSDVNLVDFPKTLRGLVSARIKRLSAEQRGLMQRAAVLGQRFNVDLLSAITAVRVAELKPILQGLKDAGLLIRFSANEFAFASDLMRDVVYDGIVFSDRKEIHFTVARSIEEMFADRLDEFVERLAVHYREGGERAKAVTFLIRAGKKVASDYSHQIALDYYLKALELLHNVSRPDLDRILSVYLPIGELAIKTNSLKLGREKMRLAEELAEETGDKRRLVQIMRLNAELQARSDRYLESQQYFQRAIELADELDDIGLRCDVRATAGQVYIWLGDMKKAIPYYRDVVELMAQNSSGDENAQASLMSLSLLANAEANAGENDRAQQTLDDAEKFIGPNTDPVTRCKFEQARGRMYYMRREIEKSTFYNMKSLEISKEYDLKDMVAKDAHNIGDNYLTLGDFRKAFTYLRMSQEVAKEIGHDLLLNLNNIFLAFIDALKFGSNEGLVQLERALAVANERNTVWEQVQVHYFLGRIHFERSDYSQARSHLRQTIRIGRAADNKIYDAPAVDLLEQIDETEGTTSA